MVQVLFKEIISLIIILIYWELGYQMYAWSRQGRVPDIHYFIAPGWVNFLCGRHASDGQLAVSGLFIQGGAWLWVLLMILRVPEDMGVTVFLIFFTLLLVFFLALIVVQAVSRIMKKF